VLSCGDCSFRAPSSELKAFPPTGRTRGFGSFTSPSVNLRASPVRFFPRFLIPSSIVLYWSLAGIKWINGLQRPRVSLRVPRDAPFNRATSRPPPPNKRIDPFNEDLTPAAQL